MHVLEYLELSRKQCELKGPTMGRQLATIGIVAVTLVVCLRVCAAQAGYFERSEVQAERSLRGEFESSSVPLLRRSTILSPEEVASALMSIEPLNANGNDP